MGAHLSVPMYRRSPPVGGCPACGGSLEAYTKSGRGSVGLVALAEGPMITAQLTGFGGLPTIGAPVRAVVRRLYEEEGVIRYGFKFQPEEVTGP